VYTFVNGRIHIRPSTKIIDIANILFTFDIFQKSALWKIFSNWVCTCHCTVVFPYLLKSGNRVRVPDTGNCNRYPVNNPRDDWSFMGAIGLHAKLSANVISI